MKTVLEQLALLEEHADTFVQHWMDDDGNDAQDKADAQKASAEITEAGKAVRAHLAAGTAMLAVLKPIVESGALDDNLSDLKAQALALIAQATAAGITPAKTEG
jgi:hypothetical protein